MLLIKPLRAEAAGINHLASNHPGALHHHICSFWVRLSGNKTPVARCTVLWVSILWQFPLLRTQSSAGKLRRDYGINVFLLEQQGKGGLVHQKRGCAVPSMKISFFQHNSDVSLP